MLTQMLFLVSPVSEYILDHFVMLFELAGLSIILYISAHISKRMRVMTLVTICLLLLNLVITGIEMWTHTFEKLSIARPLLTACVYSLYPIILIMLMQVTIVEPMGKKKFIILLIPEIVSIPLYFSSQWTKLIFYFTDDNGFQGGPLRYWPYVLFILYSVIFVIRSLIYFRKYSRRNRFVLVFISIVPFIGVFTYLFTGYSSEYTAIFTTTVILYYLFMYIHMAKIDPLTGLLNRQSFYQDISSHIDNITAVLSVDMNNLKEINDSQGHFAGDEAIKAVTKVLLEKCGNGGRAYRIGGDEFIILYTNTPEEDIIKNIETMRASLGETLYSCAFGYVMCKQYDTIEAALKEADQKMYEDKARIKNRQNQF